MIALSTGEVTQPSRVLREVKPYGGYFAPMPAVSDNAAGVKLVSFCPGNAGLGIHTRKAMTLLFEPETDETLTIMQGAGISEWRTAAVLGPPRAPSSGREALAILGTGVQARSHVEAMRCVRDFVKIRVWGRTPKKTAAFIKSMAASQCQLGIWCAAPM